METQKNEIEEILKSLDGIQRSQANPFLFEKIKGRMQSQKSPIASPAFAKWAIALGLITMLNVFTWIKTNSDNRETDSLKALASEFGFTNTTYHY